MRPSRSGPSGLPAVLAGSLALLTACGGGGSSPVSEPPFIAAELKSFAPGSAPGSGFAVAGFDQVPITVTGMLVTPRDPGVEARLQGLTWTGTQYVAVGSGGAILTSP